MKFKKTKITHIRVDADTKRKMDLLKKDIMIEQGKPITNRELLKRNFNIPNLKNVLVEDAKAKRRFRR